MKLKRSIGFALSVMLFLGVSAQADFTIKGSVDLADSIVVVHKITPTSIKAIDTIRTDHKGKFKFVGSEENSTIYYLTFGQAKPPGVPLMVQNGQDVKLKVENSFGFPYEVKGGQLNDDMHDLHSIYTRYDGIFNEMNREIEMLNPVSLSTKARDSINVIYGQIMEIRSQEIDSFIDEKDASPVLYFAVRFLFAKPDAALIVKANDKMQESIPTSVYSQEIAKVRATFGPVVEGAMAPDIILESVNGDTLRLSSLRGKVVLIDFWASWCGPCRKENPHVVKLYEKYKDRGFEIFGVSLDNNERMWKAAITKDSLSWIHVSDLKGWSSSAAKLYGVHGIPQTFLVDAEGRIYKTGLRSEQLDQILEKLLAENN